VRENLRRALGDPARSLPAPACTGRRAGADRLPARHISRLARRCYVNAALTFCEFARMRKMNQQEILGLIESVEGEEYFIEAGGTQKPYIAITGHLGNWELMGAYFAIKGVPLTVIAKPIHNPLVDRYVNSIRAAKGYDVISTREGMKRVVSQLREGRVMVFLADQDARKGGIFVNFFGYPASTHTGPALFMTRMNLPMLPVFDVRAAAPAAAGEGSPVPSRDRNGTCLPPACGTGRNRQVGIRHKIIFRKPLYPPQAAKAPSDQKNRDETIRTVTEQHVRLLEEMVRAYPDQYFWFHQRWKTKPHEKSKTAVGGPS
jgi:KDO2-lipid IV(A) lauroyltransferase